MHRYFGVFAVFAAALAGSDFPAPRITAFVDSAAFVPGVRTSTLATIFGTTLSPVRGTARSLPLPMEIAGVQVLSCPGEDSVPAECGRALPLVYVGPNQINLLTPHDWQGGAVMVVRDGSASQAYIEKRPRWWSNLARFKHEAIFNVLEEPAADGSGMARRPAITDQNGRLVTTANPIREGGVYTVWFTNLGYGRPFQAGSADNLANVWSRVLLASGDGYRDQSARFGEFIGEENVLYAGPSPEFPGLFQFVFRMTVEAAGDQLRLCEGRVDEAWLKIGVFPGPSSNYVQVPVAQRPGNVCYRF